MTVSQITLHCFQERDLNLYRQLNPDSSSGRGLEVRGSNPSSGSDFSLEFQLIFPHYSSFDSLVPLTEHSKCTYYKPVELHVHTAEC